MLDNKLKSKIYPILVFMLLFFNMGCAAHGETTNRLEKWIGKYPIEGTQSFIKEPSISNQIKALAGPDLYARLTDLENKPYYLLLPIEFAEGFYILHYPPNGHFNLEDDRVFIFVNSRSLKVHLARIFEGDLVWRHGESVPIPQEVEKYATKYEFK